MTVKVKVVKVLQFANLTAGKTEKIMTKWADKNLFKN